MVSEWREVSLHDLSKDVSYGYTESATNEEIGPHFLRITDIQGGVVNWTNVPFCKINDSDLPKYQLLQGDIVVARTGNSTGENYLFEGDYYAVYASYLIRFRINKNEAFPKFVWYSMRSNDWSNFVNNVKSGSAQAGANAKVLGKYLIQLPPFPEQKAIAHVLGTLDYKIELNRRMNETLEDMAQALFKSWFVDFDPVIDNALIAGHEIPEPLRERAETRRKAIDEGKANREVAKEFPDKFKLDEDLGWIPEGWEVKNLGDLLKSVSETYPLSSVERIIFLNTGDILKGKFLHSTFSKTTGLPGQAKKSVNKGDILYSEIRPINCRFAYVYFDSSEYVVSTKLMVLRSTSNVSALFIYNILKDKSNIEHLQFIAESRSGTFPQITFEALSEIKIALPCHLKIINNYTESFNKPIFEKQLQNDKESEALTKLRDTLLPKLISGELRIPDAEKMVEEALS